MTLPIKNTYAYEKGKSDERERLRKEIEKKIKLYQNKLKDEYSEEIEADNRNSWTSYSYNDIVSRVNELNEVFALLEDKK